MLKFVENQKPTSDNVLTLIAMLHEYSNKTYAVIMEDVLKVEKSSYWHWKKKGVPHWKVEKHWKSLKDYIIWADKIQKDIDECRSDFTGKQMTIKLDKAEIIDIEIEKDEKLFADIIKGLIEERAQVLSDLEAAQEMVNDFTRRDAKLVKAIEALRELQS